MKPVLLAAGLGIAFLHIFYRAIESQWPQAYFGGSTATHAVNANPVRYLAFRFFPVFTVCLFVAVTIERLGANVSIAVYGVALGHALLTTIRGVWAQVVGTERLLRNTPLLLLQSVVTVGFGLMALLAIYTRTSLGPLVPPVEELTATLWTALLAGVVGAYLLAVTRSGAEDSGKLLAASRRRIPETLWQYSEQEAARANTDPDLVHAIMIVENLARPAWFRRIERLKGLVFKHGTYGIMQIESPLPITDLESVDLAIGKLRGVGPFTTRDGYLDYQALRTFAKFYNDDGDYADLVAEAYGDLRRHSHSP